MTQGGYLHCLQLAALADLSHRKHISLVFPNCLRLRKAFSSTLLSHLSNHCFSFWAVDLSAVTLIFFFAAVGWFSALLSFLIRVLFAVKVNSGSAELLMIGNENSLLSSLLHSLKPRFIGYFLLCSSFVLRCSGMTANMQGTTPLQSWTQNIIFPGVIRAYTNALWAWSSLGSGYDPISSITPHL